MSVLSPNSFFSLVLTVVVAVQDDFIEIKLELFSASFLGFEWIKLFEFFDFFVSEGLLIFLRRDESNLSFGHGADFAQYFFEFNEGELDFFWIVHFLLNEVK